jgi:hypothetical protein
MAIQHKFLFTRKGLLESLGEEFTLEDFQRKFKYEPKQLMAAVRELEKENIIEYNLLDRCRVL